MAGTLAPYRWPPLGHVLSVLAVSAASLTMVAHASWGGSALRLSWDCELPLAALLDLTEPSRYDYLLAFTFVVIAAMAAEFCTRTQGRTYKVCLAVGGVLAIAGVVIGLWRGKWIPSAVGLVLGIWVATDRLVLDERLAGTEHAETDAKRKEAIRTFFVCAFFAAIAAASAFAASALVRLPKYDVELDSRRVTVLRADGRGFVVLDSGNTRWIGRSEIAEIVPAVKVSTY